MVLRLIVCSRLDVTVGDLMRVDMRNFDLGSTLRRRPSLRATALLFVAAVCLCLLALNLWQAWSARDAQLRNATTATANLARSLAQHAQQTFETADTILIGLRERFERDGTGPEALARTESHMRNRAAYQRRVHGLYLLDEHGDRLASSIEGLPTKNYADREYFRYHQTHAEDDLLIGPPVQGKGDGVWIVTITRRVNHPDGSFAGVVNATLALDQFQKFYDTFDIGDNGVITLTNGVGTIVVRRPFSAANVGRTMGGSAIFRDHVDASESRSFEYKALLDAEIRMGSYHRVRGFDLLVIVGRQKSEVLGDWWLETKANFLVTLATLLLVAVLGWYLTRQINNRLQVERQLAAANAELGRISMTDPLTGIANRRRFDQQLQQEWTRGLRHGNWVALLMIDVDQFKSFNDTYGHPDGDKCLQAIAIVLEQSLRRPADLAARYGGEEFVAILPDTDQDGALVVANAIREALARLAFPHVHSHTGFVTVSVGAAALLPSPDVSETMLVQLADEVLYQAKKQGRDRIMCAVAPMRPKLMAMPA